MISHLMMKSFPEIPGGGESRTLCINNISGIELPLVEKDLHQMVMSIETELNVSFREVELVFVDENEIVRINREHLNRDYVTDIISFNYNETDQRYIEGTLYCCAQRIKEQSGEFQTEPRHEFQRVVIHGLLHLTGYNDQTSQDKDNMTKLENRILSLINKGSN